MAIFRLDLNLRSWFGIIRGAGGHKSQDGENRHGVA